MAVNLSMSRDFIRADIGLPSVWEGLRGQIYLGSDALVQRMQALADQPLVEVPRAQRRPMAQPLAQYIARTLIAKSAWPPPENIFLNLQNILHAGQSCLSLSKGLSGELYLLRPTRITRPNL